MLRGDSPYTVTCTYPKGKPLLTVDVPEDMDIDQRFECLRDVIAMHKSIISDDKVKRGLTKPGSLSSLLKGRKS